MIFMLETSLKEALMPLLPLLFQKSQELLILSIFALLDLWGTLQNCSQSSCQEVDNGYGDDQIQLSKCIY
jgi:hypothetical protein